MERLPAHQKRRILEKVLKEGFSVSSVCRQNKISRKTFYAWKKKYLSAGPRNKSSCLEKRHLRGLEHPRGVRLRFKKDILRLVTLHPDWGSHTISQKLKVKGQKFGNHGVYTLLKELDLETYSKRKEFACSYRSPLRLLPEARKRLVEEVVLVGRRISEAAREYKVSRKTLWKWEKRYREAQEKKIELLLALKDQNPTGFAHPRGTPEWLERKILEAVLRNPEYSTHTLAQIIPQIGNHGIQNVLFRNGLNTFDRRLAYAQTQAPVSLVQPVTGWLGRLKTVWQTFVPTIAPAPPPKVWDIAKAFLTSFTSSSLLSLAFLFWLQMLSGQPSSVKLGLFFASIALSVGSFFFAYSMKYYLTLALVLSFSRQPLNQNEFGSGQASENGNGGNGGWLKRIFGISFRGPTSKEVGPPQVPAGGLQPNLEHIKLERYPFISVHLPFYNEKKVANRILSACTSFDYPNFEVIVCDDSTDETATIVKQFASQWNDQILNSKSQTNSKSQIQNSKPIVKVIHRDSRLGFKGGALREALKHMDPKTEFVIVFDADFIPYPDTLEQFLKYFKATGGWSEEKNYQTAPIQTMPYQTFQKVEISSQEQELIKRQEQELVKESNIACIAGYQWHVLNKSENWITRGVRTEYAGSYVIERPGQEILGALKIIHGSVYCIRADVLKHFGWGTSITEDFELTLRLYEKGFKVVYTPYVQAPSECVSTIKRLIRQRMRWAEGHSFNIRRMFMRLMVGKWEAVEEDQNISRSGEVKQITDNSSLSLINRSTDSLSRKQRKFSPSPLTLTEKLEFLYLSPYYLQAFFFLVGTFSWLMAETVFRARLPFWTSLWGWSLVLTNFFALPLVNAVGLFLEESEEKDYLGIISFIFLSYLLVPFQAYASVKGFIESQEGPWFRTPKTGLITDIFTRGRFYRWISGILPGRIAPAAARMSAESALISAAPKGADISVNPYLALVSANQRFNNFHIKPKKMKWIAKTFLVILLILSLNLSWLSFKVPFVQASPGTQIKTIEMPIYQYAANADDTDITAYNGIKNGTYAASHDTGQHTSQAFYNSLPYIAYYDVTMGDLKFIKCGNDTCSSGNTITTVDGALVKDGSVEADVGKYASLQVISGTPYISYYDVTNTNLKFVKCGNDSCSSGNTINTISDPDAAVGTYTSLQVVSGVPYISYYGTTNSDLKFVKCGNDTCSSGNTISQVDNTEDDGQYNSLAFYNGIPYISYYDNTNGDLKFVKCGNDTCSSGNTINTVDNGAGYNVGQYTSLQVVSGVPYIAYHHVYNQNLMFVKCGNDSCSSANTINTIDSVDIVGLYTSLQVIGGIPYISYYLGSGAVAAEDLKFVKCGNDACSSGNTINTVDNGAGGNVGQYTSLQFLSGIPYISYYAPAGGSLRFVKCGDDTCDNTPANTLSTPSTGGFGAGFHLEIPETMVDCRSDLTGTNPCYAYVEWRTILSDVDLADGEMKFGREEDTVATQALTDINDSNGESQPAVIRQDVTSKVQQGFATYSFDAYLNIARNTDSAKLVVTYEYDDSSATQVKTVRQTLGTWASQSVADSYGTISISSPNIQEANIAVQKAWVEMTGQVSAGAADTGARVDFQNSGVPGYAVGTTSTNTTMIDGDNKTTMDFVAMYEPTSVVASGATAGKLNYNASNTISLYNTGQVMNLKGGELLITYNYSYYNTTNTTHRNTVRYHVGQLSGALPTAYTQIGAPVVYLPESSLSNYNVYLKMVGTNTAAAATRYRVTITGGSAVEYPSASTYYATVVSEQAGRNIIFIDISSNFNTNWASGDTVTVEALGDTANETYAIGAELILSYNFVIPVGSGTFTNIKTVNWYIGQQTAKAVDAYQPTFNTYIPETSTTKRSSGASGDYVISATGNNSTSLAIGGSGVTSAYTTTGENVTLSIFYAASALTNVSQTGVTSSIQVCLLGDCLNSVDSLKGHFAYTTYEVSAPQAPEVALIFLPLAFLLPKFIQKFVWYVRIKKRYALTKLTKAD